LLLEESAARKGSAAERVPALETMENNGYRAPIPYRRIKPKYTPLANSYGVKATVDVVVDLDADGTIKSATVERWAGFGLDESALEAIRSMNWRPAEYLGKSYRTSFLVRYNFKEIEN
jgi:TonB family protein